MTSSSKLPHSKGDVACGGGERPRLSYGALLLTVGCFANVLASFFQIRDVGAVPGDCTDVVM